MKKFLILTLFIALFITGCSKEKAAIFFSSNPITQQSFSVAGAEKVFQAGSRINFVLLNPKPFSSSILRLQILKINEKVGIYGYSMAQGRDIEIDTNIQYAIDSFCLHKEGYYILRIFSNDNLNKPIAEADFRITPL